MEHIGDEADNPRPQPPQSSMPLMSVLDWLFVIHALSDETDMLVQLV